MHQPIAREISEVTQALMAGVEQAQLHQLVGCDVVDQQHADFLERRATVAEVVLEHPGGERLGDDGPAVVDPPEFGCHDVDRLGGGRRGGDPVHHRVGGELRVRGDPFAETGIRTVGVGGERVPRDVTVALDVVARHDRR